MDDTTETPPAGTPSAILTPEGPSETRAPDAFSTALAGLQAGMVGVLWMLAWLGIASSLSRRGFWMEENLFSTAFYGGESIRAGFGSKTVPGLALYLIVYSLLGCLFALVLRDRVRPFRAFLAALVFALGWFYLSFHLLWKSAIPLAYLLYAERPMIVGHLIYGACLARFPVYLPGAKRPAVAPVEITAPPEVPLEITAGETPGKPAGAAEEAINHETPVDVAPQPIPHETANGDGAATESPTGNATPPQARE